MPLDEDIPEHWDPMPANTTAQAFPITAGTAEYNEVLNLFQASCNRTISKVVPILHSFLYLFFMCNTCK